MAPPAVILGSATDRRNRFFLGIFAIGAGVELAGKPRVSFL